MKAYILSIDQSTSGTKAILFDESGALIGRSDIPHEQKISANGWIAHDPLEIYANVIQAVKNVVDKTGVDKNLIKAAGISNQRETALVWERATGLPVYDAIVWQCVRGAAICERIEARAEDIRQRTGLRLSAYFSAAKIAWVLENIEIPDGKEICAGTMDTFLLYRLTNGKSFKTDYSNASRTQLFNITTLAWDEEICALFGIDPATLAAVCDSNACFGETDFEGFLTSPIPIHAVLGDSHAALFGQGCITKGGVKATYGTGSSVMLHIGDTPICSDKGVVTSLAWRINGKVSYVMEGNINYSGSVITWVVDELGLLESAKEAGKVALLANPEDTTYLVPAFTGLGAPYWKSGIKAMICGMTRHTGRAEIVRAAEDCIAYQVADIINLMREEGGGGAAVHDKLTLTELHVDGGPTKDSYLMQFQSDILDIPVSVPANEELSGIGAAYMAGLAIGLYNDCIFNRMDYKKFTPGMDKNTQEKRYNGWKDAIAMICRDKEK